MSDIKRTIDDSDYGSYYSVRTHCQNCGKHDWLYVRKGVLKPATVKCEACGCRTSKTGAAA